MTGKGPGTRKFRLFRSIQRRILVCQAPLILFLLAMALYWAQGYLDRGFSEAGQELGRHSVRLAAAAVRHSTVSGSESPGWDRIQVSLPNGENTQIEVVSLASKILYASDPALRGRTYNRFSDSPCASCHVKGSPRAAAETKVLAEPGRGSYQIFVSPLINGPDCRACHRDEGSRLGMVYVRQSLSPVWGRIGTVRAVLLLAGVVALGFTILSSRLLLGRYLNRPRLEAAAAVSPAGTARSETSGPPPSPTTSAGPADSPEEIAGQLRESLQQIEQQRDELSMLYYIADQLSRSIQPNVLKRRAVELASSVFGSACVLIAGHFHPDSRAFHGTVTYHGPGGEIIERPFPDEEVKKSAPYANAAIVERWLRGELDGVVRLREEPTVAYPLERHGRRLGLLLAPARARGESPDGRPTAANPEVVQVARKHLAIALEMSELQRERLQEERLAAIGQTVAGISHCLKNTLNGLKGGKFIIERALATETPEKFHKGLAVLGSSIQHMERITHDMLTYAADRALDFQPGNPNDTMRDIINLLEESARSKGIDLVGDLDESMPMIPLDQNALYRAVLNLVTNAIEACVESENGSTVTLRSRSKTDSVLLTVHDNGVGIPEEHLRRITERFFTTKSSTGTGLGLPVVQKIAEQHGGTLEVESVLGQGSSFHLRIPRDVSLAVDGAGRARS